MFSDPGTEREIALRLRSAAAHAQPNPRIVAFADALLGRDGRMMDALDAMGPARVVFEGHLFQLSLKA
jgi:predicted protein tyrosine phosphatase